MSDQQLKCNNFSIVPLFLQDHKLKHMADLQQSVVTDPETRHQINQQILQWEENLERLHCEQFRLRCYMASLQSGELPNPKVNQIFYCFFLDCDKKFIAVVVYLFVCNIFFCWLIIFGRRLHERLLAMRWKILAVAGSVAGLWCCLFYLWNVCLGNMSFLYRRFNRYITPVGPLWEAQNDDLLQS